jgi:hypothetical protein
MPVVTLVRPLELDHKDGVASLTLWLCDPFDFGYSFRGALLRIEKALAASAPTTHSLPPREVNEDFIEGQLVWGSRTFSIYFEHALGYMQFSSPSLGDVQALQAAL